MEREFGKRERKLWLIGDSEPNNNSDKLEHPFDLRHPTVHNIFTPILEQIQDNLFDVGNRIDWNKLYIRNAVKSSNDWDDESTLKVEIENFTNLINAYSPIIIFTFGTRAFEFVRRARDEESRALDFWTTEMMGKEFAKRCKNFDVNSTNVIPLLHASICRGRFLEAHGNFCSAVKEINGMDENNYFIATGKIIASIVKSNKSNFGCLKISC